VSPASRRRPPTRHASGYGTYAGQDEYAYAPGYEPGYEYDYGPDRADDWWEEGTGGLFSPVRLLLYLLVIGSGATAIYGMFIDRTLPITVSGLAVLGLSLALLAFSAAHGAASLGRRGYGGRALLAALFGGLCAMGAAGSLAGAFVLGMLAASA